ncbi:MAG: 5-methylthioadenosine/S-adenosylhomocysteine nucleosidase [Chloroflexota bacterium]
MPVDQRPVLIAAALREERAALERRSTEPGALQLAGLPDGDLLSGRLGGRAVALLRCGVGKVAAASAVAAACAIEPRCIISVGSAAALHAGHRVGDVVVSTEVVQHDFAAVSASGFTLFGYGSDWPSEGEPLLRSDPALARVAEEAARVEGAARGFAVSVGRIATGDWFVNDRATRDAIAARTDADLVEMEGAAIAFVAQRYGVPWIVIRSVSDAGDAAAPTAFDEYLPIAATNAAAIVEAILPKLP